MSAPTPDTVPEISVVICTHNRSDLLRQLLTLLIPQAVSHPVEVIVVDSASSPAEAARVRSLVHEAGCVRLVRVDQIGVSLARNAGLAAARAPWIATLDDDEMPVPHWLETARALIRRLPASCGVCGGNVIPRFPSGQVPNLGPYWSGYLSTIDRCGEFDQTETLKMGLGHSLMRTEAATSVGGFSPDLGRIGAPLLSGEDVLFVQQLIDAGWRIWHSDRLRVDHIIPAERLTSRWVCERAYWEGKSVARLSRIHDPGTLHDKALRLACKLVPLAALTALVGHRWEMDLRFAYVRGFLHEYARGLTAGRVARNSKAQRDRNTPRSTTAHEMSADPGRAHAQPVN